MEIKTKRNGTAHRIVIDEKRVKRRNENNHRIRRLRRNENNNNGTRWNIHTQSIICICFISLKFTRCGVCVCVSLYMCALFGIHIWPVRYGSMCMHLNWTVSSAYVFNVSRVFLFFIFLLLFGFIFFFRRGFLKPSHWWWTIIIPMTNSAAKQYWKHFHYLPSSLQAIFTATITVYGHLKTPETIV